MAALAAQAEGSAHMVVGWLACKVTRYVGFLGGLFVLAGRPTLHLVTEQLLVFAATSAWDSNYSLTLWSSPSSESSLHGEGTTINSSNSCCISSTREMTYPPTAQLVPKVCASSVLHQRCIATRCKTG